jgi:hypothetical protein
VLGAIALHLGGLILGRRHLGFSSLVACKAGYSAR